MKIDLQWLIDHDACDEGIEWFKNEYGPEEVEVLDVVHDAPMDEDYAGWLVACIVKDLNLCVSTCLLAARTFNTLEHLYRCTKRRIRLADRYGRDDEEMLKWLVYDMMLDLDCYDIEPILITALEQAEM